LALVTLVRAWRLDFELKDAVGWCLVRRHVADFPYL
jgi:hypothetical protein